MTTWLHSPAKSPVPRALYILLSSLVFCFTSLHPCLIHLAQSETRKVVLQWCYTGTYNTATIPGTPKPNYFNDIEDTCLCIRSPTRSNAPNWSGAQCKDTADTGMLKEMNRAYFIASTRQLFGTTTYARHSLIREAVLGVAGKKNKILIADDQGGEYSKVLEEVQGFVGRLIWNL